MHVPALVASDMTVNALSVAMIVLGIVLLVVTLRFWASAGEDPEVLAPLEVMGDRRFARAGDAARVELLNTVRPDGAERVDHIEAPPVLDHEPAEQERPFRDPFDHADDAVDVVAAVPAFIDPLLHQQHGTVQEDAARGGSSPTDPEHPGADTDNDKEE